MGKNNVLNPASPLSLQQLDGIRMMHFVPGFVLNDICLLSQMIRADPVPKRIWYSLSTFTPPSPAYLRFLTVGTVPSTPISTAFLFLSLLQSPLKLICPILHNLSTPNFLPFYFLLSLSASSLLSPDLPACSNLTNLFFIPCQALSSHYLLAVPFPLVSYSHDTGQLCSFLMLLSSLHSNLSLAPKGRELSVIQTLHAVSSVYLSASPQVPSVLQL